MTRIGSSYEEALATILDSVTPLGPEDVGLAEAAGRVLALDYMINSQSLAAGNLLRPEDLAWLAASGIARVSVVRRPRVAIVAAGDELLPAGAPPAPGKIYDSDSPLLAALVQRDGGQPLVIGIAHDNLSSLRMRIAAAIAAGAELILTIAGTDHGNHDMVRELIEAEGELLLWRAAIEPDRPLLVGTLAGIPVLGLPGDPTEAMVCAELFVRPALLRLAGQRDISRPTVEAALEVAVPRHQLRHYLRGTVRTGAYGYAVRPTVNNATDHSPANALIVIPPGEGELPAGSPVETILLV